MRLLETERITYYSTNNIGVVSNIRQMNKGSE
jgi:hypothetical protein